ncbi:MAG: alpha/beta fold hydrolase [Deltaproteobacteria bacterium]|nr:alpha/beta fold hydrolase [Deltaproteobacteria bacterium]
MADAAEHVARAALRLRGYGSRFVPTSVGAVHAMERRGSGNGPPLVLMHGFGSSGVHYRPLLRRLEKKVSRIVTLDMPAHGFSEVPQGPVDPHDLLTGLFEAIDDVVNEPAVLFGNSMGGYAAVRYALAHQSRVRALVLASPAGAQVAATHLEDLRQLFAIRDHRGGLEFIDRLLGRPSALRHVMAWGVRRKFSKPELIQLLEAVDPEIHALTPEEVASLTMPTLFIWGAEDEILPEEHLRFWRDHLPPHIEVERPAGMGHSPFLDRPGALSRRVAQFLDGLE